MSTFRDVVFGMLIGTLVCFAAWQGFRIATHNIEKERRFERLEREVAELRELRAEVEAKFLGPLEPPEMPPEPIVLERPRAIRGKR